MVLLDIDMPYCCNNCPLYDDRWDYPTCYATQHSMGYKFNPFEKKMPDCPLHETIIKMKYFITENEL